jgi:hypothetical protein
VKAATQETCEKEVLDTFCQGSGGVRWVDSCIALRNSPKSGGLGVDKTQSGVSWIQIKT